MPQQTTDAVQHRKKKQLREAGRSRTRGASGGPQSVLRRLLFACRRNGQRSNGGCGEPGLVGWLGWMPCATTMGKRETATRLAAGRAASWHSSGGCRGLLRPMAEARGPGTLEEPTERPRGRGRGRELRCACAVR